MFIDLVHNVALLLALGLLYDIIVLKPQRAKPSLQQLFIGVAIGAIGIAVMLSPWEFTPGIIFDTRSIMLSIAGLFFGTVPILIAVLMTAALRLYQDGGGVWMGVAVIVTAGGIGLAWRHLRHNGLEDISMPELYLFGVVVHLAMLLETILLPWSVAFEVLSKISLPVIILYPIGTVFLGKLMAGRLVRQRAEETLAVQARRLDYILQGTNVGTWEWNVQTGATVFNERWADIIGYTLEEISPVSIDTWMKFSHPDDLKESDRLLQACFSGESEYYHCECRMRHKSGEWVWVLDRGKVATWTEDGKPEWMYGTHQDITARKRAEEELRESEMKFRNLSESTITGIMLYQNDYWIYANPAAEEITGYTFGELKQMKFWEFTVPEYGDLIKERGRARQKGKLAPSEYEFKIITKQGKEKWVLLTGNTTELKSGKAGLIMLIDITKRKQSEAELEKLNAQLNQAQKMESVGRLAGGVAHDFNNMLGVILGHTDMILEGMDPDQPFHADLMEIKKAGERSADLTRQLLAFARKQTVAPKVLDLNQSVEDMLKMLHRLIGEDIDMAWIPGEAVWPVKIDPAQIDQILANLCVNARDAIADVGKVTIETGNMVFDEEYCKEHAGFVPGEYTLLAVSDNGCGMNAETLENVFEPFFTTKESNQGSGLGLATVYGAVKQNNGFINVYSEPGKSTTFKIYLPRHAARAAETKEPKTMAAERGSETILLVEDEPAILKMTTRMLEQSGYKVLAAATPGEALALAREHLSACGDAQAGAGEIHLLMTDVVMPEMNGRDLAKNLSSLYPNLKRLFMSGYTANVIAHHGVLDEGVHFIQKPFSKGDLTVKVRKALED